MSDSDEFEYESDDAFQDGDEGDGDDEAIQIENTFYEADDNKASRPEEALEQFHRVVEMEQARGPEVVWRFKALQHIVILCARLSRYDEMATQYQQLLGLMSSVSQNDASKTIHTVLDAVPAQTTEVTKLESIYHSTLDALKASSNLRLWFNVSVKLAKVYLELGDYAKLTRLIRELHRSCQTQDGADDAAKASLLLEVYALEIQLCAMTKNSVRMKEIYPKTLHLTSAIVDPRNVAVIRESGGRMFMAEKKWEEAYNEFWESFKNYQETGNPRAKLVLKYVVLSNMLALSDINPFDSREAKVYQEDPEIAAMSSLRTAYGKNDIKAIDKLLNDTRNRIQADQLVKTHVSDLLQKIRLQVLQSLILPYRVVALSFLASELNTSVDEVRELLVTLILDEKIQARIDGTAGFLEVSFASSEKADQFLACDKWVDALEKLQSNLCGRLTALHS